MELLWHVLFLFLVIKDLNCALLPWPEDVILTSENNPWNGNEYWYRFNTLLGITRSETGTLKTTDNGHPYIDVIGQIAYPVNGMLKKIQYKADDKGFNILNTNNQRDTKKNATNVLLKSDGGDDNDKIQFPVENVTTTDNITDILDFDDRYGGNVPPAVLATLLGGGK